MEKARKSLRTTLYCRFSRGSWHGHSRAPLRFRTETSPAQSKTRPWLPEKGSAVLSTEVTPPRARRERGSGSPARQPLATQHFCNFRTDPRRKTNRAWEPSPSPAPDARCVFSNICICDFFFPPLKGLSAGISSAPRWGSLGRELSCDCTDTTTGRAAMPAGVCLC